MSGIVNAVGSESGIIGSDVYPSGHVIKSSTYTQESQSGHLGGTSSSYADTGCEVAHVTASSSDDSYIIYHFWSGMFNLSPAQNAGETDVTMRTVSNSTYTSGESIVVTDYPTYYAIGSSSSLDWYVPNSLRYHCGTTGGMAMPATKTSWAAGDTLYFRLFYLASSGTFRVCHTNGSWNISATEVKK